MLSLPFFDASQAFFSSASQICYTYTLAKARSIMIDTNH